MKKDQYTGISSLLIDSLYSIFFFWAYYDLFLMGFGIFIPIFLLFFIFYISLLFKGEEKKKLNFYITHALQLATLGVWVYGYFIVDINLTAKYLSGVCFPLSGCFGGVLISPTPLMNWYFGLLTFSFFLSLVSLFVYISEKISQKIQTSLVNTPEREKSIFQKLLKIYLQSFGAKLIVSIFLFFGFFSWGIITYNDYRYSLPENCFYGEKEISLPSELSHAKIILEKNAYVGRGQESSFRCLPFFGTVQNRILSPDDVFIKEGNDFYTYSGFTTVEPFQKGKVFSIEKIIGFSPRDIRISSVGRDEKRYFLILKDEENNLYSVEISGYQSKDGFLALKKYSSPNIQDSSQVLSMDSFLFSKDSVQYTGK